jgi:hypothetical protein
MSELGTSALTLIDWAKRTDKDGKISKIVEILNTTNQILDDMAFVEGNLPTGHKTTIRSGLPSVTWRLLNYGVQPTKSRTVQVTDTCGMLEAYSEVDKALADLNGNTSEFRLSEDRAFLEAMNQEMASTLFYGNTSVDPEKFMGLAPRYNSLSAENASNIISGSGASGNTSVWLVCWGDQTIHGIFPKGSKAGFTHEDLGQETLFDNQTPAGRYEGYRSHYKWDTGLTLKDWRYVVRIANVQVSALTKNAGTGADIIDLMSQAMEVLPATMMGRCVFYCNRTVKSFLRRQIANRVAANLTLDTVSGKTVMAFDGIPVKRCDALLSTEAAVA